MDSSRGGRCSGENARYTTSRGSSWGGDFDGRDVHVAGGIGTGAPQAQAVFEQGDGEAHRLGQVFAADMQLDGQAVGMVFAGRVADHVATGDQKEARSPLEEEAAGIGQVPAALERLHPDGGQKEGFDLHRFVGFGA